MVKSSAISAPGFRDRHHVRLISKKRGATSGDLTTGVGHPEVHIRHFDSAIGKSESAILESDSAIRHPHPHPPPSTNVRGSTGLSPSTASHRPTGPPIAPIREAHPLPPRRGSAPVASHRGPRSRRPMEPHRVASHRGDSLLRIDPRSPPLCAAPRRSTDSPPGDTRIPLREMPPRSGVCMRSEEAV